MTVNQIYDLYPNNRTNRPIPNTKGYVFYDWTNDGIQDHMEYFEAGAGTDYFVMQTNGVNTPYVRNYDGAIDINGSAATGTATYIPLNEL